MSFAINSKFGKIKIANINHKLETISSKYFLIMSTSPHTPMNGSPVPSSNRATLDVPEEMSFLTPVSSPATAQRKATANLLKNVKALNLETVIDAGEPLSEETVNGDSDGEGEGGEGTSTTAEVKEADIPRRVIRTAHMEKCVPCQWLRKSVCQTFHFPASISLPKIIFFSLPNFIYATKFFLSLPIFFLKKINLLTLSSTKKSATKATLASSASRP